MELTAAPITGAALALIYLFLSIRVIRIRRSEGIGIGDGGNHTLQRAVRAHANFGEYAPFVFALLLTLELMEGVSSVAPAIIGGLLVIGRTLHALGLLGSAGPSTPRVVGMVLTFSSILLSAVALVVAAFMPTLG